ncbi:Uncharacterized protein SCF082_LOCUS53448 [Durusdinium trenchii]|uniref:Uncharacterized protein n=1 Tax=Durusdinium trenchii TaxID=1381693 RepID=A0ABP0STN8_9DINO
MPSKPKKKAKLATASSASHVIEETQGLHSVSDESRRVIYNATCKALDLEEASLDKSSWQKLNSKAVPDIFYPVELPGVEAGKPVTFYMSDVKKCIKAVIERCPNYGERIEQLLNHRPETVFQMLLYNDEASGGNILAPNSGKKASLWYFSLKEAGFLWSDTVWHPLSLLQHQQFEQIQGGFSAAVRKIVLELNGQDLKHGIPVQFPNRLGLVRLDYRYMISDLDSIRYALDAKGSAAIRRCVFCKNCIKKHTNLEHYNDFFEDITSHRLERFHRQSDSEIFSVVDNLSAVAPNVSRAALQKKEIACGFRFNPAGLLSDPLARDALPPSAFLLDFMHLYWSCGIISWEVNALHAKWSETGIGDLEQFLSMEWRTSVQSCTPSFRKRLVAPLTLRRKHKQFKSHIGLHRYDPKVQEDKGEFSHFVQREIWKHHITSLAAYQFGTALQGAQSSSETVGQSLGESNCMVAKKVLHKGHTYSENDVLLGAHPCTVDSAVQDGTEFYLLIQPLEIEERTEFWSSWRVTGRKRLLHISLAGRSPTWWLQLDAEKLLCLH